MQDELHHYKNKMWIEKVLLFFLSLTALSCLGEKARFDNYKVVSVVPTSEKQVKVLKKLDEANVGFDFWRRATLPGVDVHAMVPPHLLAKWSEFITKHGLTQNVLQNNLQSAIEEEEKKRINAPKHMEWTHYHNLDEIYKWLDELESKYPGVVKVVKVGFTYEKRDIKAITITFGAKNPGVFHESGIHAREWITPASTTWMINEMLTSPQDSIWRRFNYLYIPVMNPDGYVYSRTKDRSWRKNRRPTKGSHIGVDLNRNYDIAWNTGKGIPPSHQTYPGPKAFSEPETKSVSDYLLKVGKNYDIFLGYHSWVQLIMYPWGYKEKSIPTVELHKRIGELAAKDIKDVDGLTFRVGSIYDLNGRVGGSSIDWYYATFNKTLTYIFEERLNVFNGYQLPPEQIIIASKEIQAGVKRILMEYEKLKKM